MKLKKISAVLGAAITLSAMAFSSSAHAEAVTGTAGAAAHLDFTVVIPATMSFRVGALAATVSAITFQPTAAQVGTGTAVAATATSGDLGNGKVTATVTGNKSQITITAGVTGALTGTIPGTTIPWTQISTASSSAANLPAPQIPVTGTSGSVSALAPVLGITNVTAQWTYTYINTVTPAAGTYGGTGGAGNGRVTYTAAMP